MKNFLSFLAFIIGMTFNGITQDLPSPTANLVSLPAGSYIIPMDNTNQLNASSLFNLKAYGLIVHLLNNNIKVKWVITSGKSKDGIDFTVNSTQLKPVLNAVPTVRNFKAGPFVIFASDTTGVSALIDNFYASNSLSGNNRPNVFVNTSVVTVDQRYDLSGFQPIAAILSDGGNQSIHQAFMTAAGIPTSNYTVVSGLSLLSNCYTFASEPHNSKTGSDVNTAITNIKTFVSSGGNFLAECAAVSNYENNSLGRFQTTTGITVSNITVGTTVLFPNPDLSYSQFEGVFNGSLTGSVENWQINGSGTNNEHNHATGTGANASSICASVSKLVSGKGGLAFYLGNHNYSTADMQNINGIRMYMNALLTPAYQVCPSVLPLFFIRFAGNLQNGKADLQWTASKYEPGKFYEVQKSTDGYNFFTVAKVNGNENSNEYSYQTNETNSSIYYRIREVKNIGYTYSSVIKLTQIQQRLVITHINEGNLVIQYTSEKEEALSLKVFNTNGQLLLNYDQKAYRGINLYHLNVKTNLPGQMFILYVTTNQSGICTKFIL